MARSGDVQMDWNEEFFASILRTAPIRKIVDGVATKALANAKSTAPVDTGAYRGSIHLEHHESRYREAARVVADDPKALLIESKKGTLARALKAAKE